MEAVFLKLLNMSLTASVLILAVLPVRALLKRAPRWSICLLWGLVALRLICPFTLESNLSLIRTSEPLTREALAVEIPTVPSFTEPIHSEVTVTVPEAQKPTQQQTVVASPDRKAPSILTVAGYVWLAGTAAMLLYAFISFLQLKYRVSTATRLEGNICQSEYVTSPFVLGVFRPTVYLPYGLKPHQLEHVLAHERSHIRRGDHLTKPFGFMVLSVHWFNPLVWLAYILLCRDIEAACDEHVIKEMTHEQRQSYSATLLRCSVHRRRIAACPVAFGETEIKGRIKNVMNYKKPALWLVILSMLLSVVLAGCFLTDPVKEQFREQLSVSREDQKKIDALVDQIYTKLWDTSFTWLDPDSYRLIHPEARQELMAYGDTALEYLTSQLRTTTSDVHSAREQIMVYLCEDLAKAIPAGSRYSGEWSTVPGMWLTYYDMKNADQYDKSGLQPGFYSIYDVLYGDPADLKAVSWDCGREYMVTRSGLFVYETQAHYQYVTSVAGNDGEIAASGGDQAGGIRFKTHENHYTIAYRVDWKWQAPGQKDDLWSGLIGAEREEYEEHFGLKDLLAEKDYRYQPLDDDRCLIQTGTGLYTDVYLIGQSEGRLEYVYQLEKISAA